MIHYQLRCSATHEFDGWYKDSAAFEKLSKAGLVECPHCGSTEVGRALMAPAITKGRSEPPPPPVPAAPKPEAPPAAPPAGSRMAAGPMPAQIMAMLQRMRAEVERNCDYVGPDFAEEARKMARGEAEARGIYGEATDAEAEALAEDGIDVARIPWVPRADG
ncbi:MAG TPA: DUF1178 family protein [Acetobacteraceae bacterium]|nr:DUF1178 family protein [Acetobacteraceae bacterium]